MSQECLENLSGRVWSGQEFNLDGVQGKEICRLSWGENNGFLNGINLFA